MACTVSEGTRVDVAKFSSALSTLWLYSATSVRVQDHPHLICWPHSSTVSMASNSLENIGVLRQYQKALPQCPLLPQYCSNTLQWALPQCCCNSAIAAALPQYCCNTLLLQYCRNGAIAAIRCAHCSNPQCLNALPQHCGNDLLAQYCSMPWGIADYLKSATYPPPRTVLEVNL